MQTTVEDYLTPPDLAKRWRVNSMKVYNLIRSGQIEAINLAADPHGRPRLRIKLAEIERFEASRSTKPAEPKPRRRRRTASPTKDYFA